MAEYYAKESVRHGKGKPFLTLHSFPTRAQRDLWVGRRPDGRGRMGAESRFRQPLTDDEASCLSKRHFPVRHSFMDVREGQDG